RRRRRSRRLFRLAPARQPHRRMGVGAVPAARKPLRARKSSRRIHRPPRHWRDPSPALLVGLPDQAGVDRVLARPAVPPARPAGVLAGRQGCVAEDAALSVNLKLIPSDASHRIFKKWPLWCAYPSSSIKNHCIVRLSKSMIFLGSRPSILAL